MKPNIQLQIEQLVLDGIPYSQRRRVAAALEQALTQLLTEQGLPAGWQGDALPTIGPIDVSGHSRPETIGQQVAQSVYQQLSQPAPTGPTGAAPGESA